MELGWQLEEIRMLGLSLRKWAGEKEIPPETNCEKTDKKVILRIIQQTLEGKCKIQINDCNIRENFERLWKILAF